MAWYFDVKRGRNRSQLHLIGEYDVLVDHLTTYGYEVKGAIPFVFKGD